MISLKQALDQADIIFHRDDIHQAIVRVGQAIDAWLEGEPAVLLTVMNGALIFAGELSLEVSADLTFDYVHATRYHDNRGGKLKWLRKPALSLEGRNVLLADDILDEGYTLQAVRESCREMGAKDVKIATLCTKDHDRRIAGIEADFNGLMVPDRYVFGYGMDCNHQGRNLPHIYALP